MLIFEIVGWAGSFLILAAYGLNSYQRLKSDSFMYYLLNFMGGICLIIYSLYKDAFPNTFINVVWVVVAIPPIIGFLRRKKI